MLKMVDWALVVWACSSVNNTVAPKAAMVLIIDLGLHIVVICLHIVSQRTMSVAYPSLRLLKPRRVGHIYFSGDRVQLLALALLELSQPCLLLPLDSCLPFRPVPAHEGSRERRPGVDGTLDFTNLYDNFYANTV